MLLVTPGHKKIGPGHGPRKVKWHAHPEACRTALSAALADLRVLPSICKEYSRLKLRPGGPTALRTPAHLNGVPGLSPVELAQVQNSQEIQRRSRELFKAVASWSGVAITEQPPSSMAWLEPENFQCLKAFHSRLAWVGACQHNATSWCFACNNACIQCVAARCSRQDTQPLQEKNAALVSTSAP